jgi:hypothetical protein
MPLAELFRAILFRSLTNALTACSALLLFQGTPVPRQNSDRH